MYYCSRGCQHADWQRHMTECEVKLVAFEGAGKGEVETVRRRRAAYEAALRIALEEWVDAHPCTVTLLQTTAEQLFNCGGLVLRMLVDVEVSADDESFVGVRAHVSEMTPFATAADAHALVGVCGDDNSCVLLVAGGVHVHAPPSSAEDTALALVGVDVGDVDSNSLGRILYQVVHRAELEADCEYAVEQACMATNLAAMESMQNAEARIADVPTDFEFL
jgi:hypothetical protein